MCSVLKRIGNRVYPSTLRSIYHSVIHSHLSYLCPIWGPALTQDDINSIQTIQNIALRRVFSIDYYTRGLHTHEIRAKHNILSIRQMIHYNSSLLIFKLNKQLIKLDYNVTTIDNIHSYPTRGNKQIHINSYRTRLGRDSVLRAASTIYNKFKTEENDTIDKYKKRIKLALLQS